MAPPPPPHDPHGPQEPPHDPHGPQEHPHDPHGPRRPLGGPGPGPHGHEENMSGSIFQSTTFGITIFVLRVFLVPINYLRTITVISKSIMISLDFKRQSDSFEAVELYTSRNMIRIE
ncbi:hypothetical protein HUJ04_010145 [Dendroctonus ponderosae]|nr:hypothetical protein HUJ04_010145 [Dendroctonus ponderosae]